MNNTFFLSPVCSVWERFVYTQWHSHSQNSLPVKKTFDKPVQLKIFLTDLVTQKYVWQILTDFASQEYFGLVKSFDRNV